MVVFLVGGLGLAALVEDHVLVRETALLAPDLGEEGGQLVVVFLAPLLKGMMVALGALDARTEEQLGHVLELVLNRLDLTVPSDRRMLLDLP